MKIRFNLSRYDDGTPAVVITNEHGAHIEISEEWGFTTTGDSRTTSNLLRALPVAFEKAEITSLTGPPDYDAHTEEKARLKGPGDLYITNAATIGGQSTGTDGTFPVTEAGQCFSPDQCVSDKT
ncbi:MAG: hypothetical protein V6Z81_04975 [Parvularculales bacterium]